MRDLKLYNLPLGETMRDKFIEDAKQYPYGEALFVVPGRFLGQQVKKNGLVRTVIMDYLPNEILRANNYAGDFVRISRAAQEMLITEIIEELSAQGQLDYFAGLAQKKGFIKNVVALISELARGDVDKDDLQAAFTAWSRTEKYELKDSEIALIYSNYTARLKSTAFYDVDGLYRLARLILQQEGVKVPWKCLYFSEFYQFNELQLDLLKNLSAFTDIKIGLFYDTGKPSLAAATVQAHDKLIGLGFEAQEGKTEIKRAADLQQLVDQWKTDGNKSLAADHISLLKGYSLNQEMSMVLSRIKELIQSGVEPSHIICLVRSMEEYNGLSNKFREYGIPTTLQNVTNFSGQQLPDFLQRLFSAALGSMDVDKWQGLFAHPFCSLLYGVDGQKLEESYNYNCFGTVKELCNYVAEKNNVDLGPLQQLVKDLGKKQTPENLEKLLSACFDQWKLLERWGEKYRQGKCSLEELKILAKTQENTLNLIAGFILAMEQSGQSSEKVTLDTFVSYWQDNAPGITLTVESGNIKGVQVMEVTNVQAVPYDHVFILGLREGSFPNIKQENWLYNDRERTELTILGVPLKISPIALNQEQYFFGSALAMATKSLTLSYYADDKAGASSYVDEFKKAFNSSLSEESWDIDVTNCASTRELLGILAENPCLDTKAKAWGEQFWGPDFYQKTSLDKERWQSSSSYNGFLDSNLLPGHLSSSALDTYIRCPFAYLVQRVWNLDQWAPLSEEIQPVTRGTLCHNVLAEFLGSYLQKNLNDYNLEDLSRELTDIFNKVYNNLKDAGEIVEGVYADYERQDMLDILLSWLEKECEYQASLSGNILPSALEQPFGRDEANSWPPLKLQIGDDTITFSGQIDRIDSNGSKYMLTDYKTGGNPGTKEMSNGQALQLPLYVMALEQLQKVDQSDIMGAGYFSLKTGKRQNGIWQKTLKGNLPWYSTRMQNPELAEVLARTEQVLIQCVARLKAGIFPAEPCDGCSAYCQGADICRYRLSKNQGKQEDDHE